MKPTKLLLWTLLLGAATGALASPQSSKQGTIPALQQLKTQFPALGNKIDQAIDKIGDSLLDDTHRCDCDPDDGDDPEDGRSLFVAPDVLDPERGERTFDKEEAAADILLDLISKNTTPAAAKPGLQNVVNTLATVDRDISRKAIDDARAFLGSHANSNQDIQQAEARYAQGLTFIQQNKPKQAIGKFEDAWKNAMEVSAPHFAIRHAKALCTLLRNTNRRLDKISGQNNKDAKYRALGNLVVARVNQLQSRLNNRIQHFSQKTGIPQAQVLQQVNLIIQQVAGAELEPALNATIARLETLAAGNWTAPTKAALQAAANALRGIGSSVDRTAPVIANLVPAENSATQNLRPTMSATFSDALSGVKVSTIHIVLDGVDKTSLATVSATGFTFTPASNLSQAAHTLVVSLADNAGNTASATRHFTTDNQPPQVTAFVPVDGSFTSARRPAISVAYSDAASGVNTASVHLLLDGVDKTAQATVTAAGVTFTPTADLSEAQHTVTVSLSDLAGNPASASAHWTVDATLPSIAVAAPADGTLETTATPFMHVTYSDALSGVDLSSLVVMLDGLDITTRFAKTAGEATYTPAMADALSNAQHTLTARILDLAGNERAAQSVFTVQTSQPDITPPTVSMVFPRNNPFGNPSAFEGTTWRVLADARDPGPSASGIQKVEFFSDGVKFGEATSAPYETTITFPANSAGQNHVLTAVATDNATNHTTSQGITVHLVVRPATGAISFRASGGPTTIQAGSPFPGPVTIEAIDAQGNVDPAYEGFILFFTSDPRSSINSSIRNLPLRTMA